MAEAVVEDTVALTVHGPAGAVDLVVPLGASASDVAREYAAQSGSGQSGSGQSGSGQAGSGQAGSGQAGSGQADAAPVLRLSTITGRVLTPTTTVEGAGITSGSLLVAFAGEPPSPASGARPAAGGAATPPTTRVHVSPVLTAAAVGAVLAALFGRGADGWQYDALLACLALAAALGVLPVGRHVAERGVAAPAFGAALGHLLAWEPGTFAEPLTVGITGLGAALVAAVGRASGAGLAVVQTVWMVAGAGTFLASGAVVLSGAPPHLTWALLMIAALLATRSVAAVAVDVPDQMLIDLERLAVTAWSARDLPRGRRGRIMIRESAVREVLERGSRVVNSAAVAILVLVLVATPRLLAQATYDVDRPGARCLVFFTGAGILLAARSFRHPRARLLLRAAGLFAWGCLAWTLIGGYSDVGLLRVTLVCLVLAAGAVMAAMATGRGWRSAWWANKAELGETMAGALAIASLVAASGLVRMVWEIPFVR